MLRCSLSLSLPPSLSLSLSYTMYTFTKHHLICRFYPQSCLHHTEGGFVYVFMSLRWQHTVRQCPHKPTTNAHMLCSCLNTISDKIQKYNTSEQKIKLLATQFLPARLHAIIVHVYWYSNVHCSNCHIKLLDPGSKRDGVSLIGLSLAYSTGVVA